MSSIDEESGILVATFIIDGFLFGIDANHVQEVVQARKMTTVHNSESYVKGVMNLRGRVVTIIDLGEKLDLQPVSASNLNRILIVGWKQEYVGLLVDSVAEVVQIENTAIKPPPGNLNGVHAVNISGVFKNKNDILVGLLHTDRIIELTENSVKL
jgi:purine-binding chemotaxis protein CheW